MKKCLALFALIAILSLSTPAFAKATHGRDGKISGRSVGASAPHYRFVRV